MRETCEICEDTALFTIKFKNTWSPLFEDKKILVCQACGFGRIMPQLDQKQIIDFYANVYRSKESPPLCRFFRLYSRAICVSKPLIWSASVGSSIS